MATRIFLLLLLLGTAARVGAQPPADEIQADKSAIRVWPIEHASLVLSWNGNTIYADPAGAAIKYKDLPAPDIILLTDIHGDHLDTQTIKEVNKQNAIIIAPKAVIDMLPVPLKLNAIELANGAKTTQKGISFTGVPMYNLPETPDARHPRGRGNGYIIELGGKHVYLSGDTEDTKEMRGLKNIDIAFVCMNLPFTMDINQAASAVLEFKPKIVYPYHHRGQDINAFKKLVNEGDKGIEVRLKQWY